MFIVMMDKSTLLDYINGRTNATEADAVRKWANESPENMACLESLMNDVAMSCHEMVAEEEYMSFLKQANKRNRQTWKSIRTVAAAVVLPSNFPFELLNDSKKLNEEKRLKAEAVIKDKAIAYAISVISHEEIDRINILQASLLGMKKSYEKVKAEYKGINK